MCAECQLILGYIKPTNKISLSLDPEEDKDDTGLQILTAEGTLKIEVDGDKIVVDVQGGRHDLSSQASKQMWCS